MGFTWGLIIPRDISPTEPEGPLIDLGNPLIPTFDPRPPP